MEPTRYNPALDPATMPERIKALAVDPVRGFPVPWFVAWVDGKPEFRAMDHRKLVRAVKERRCWVCGEPLAKFMTFVVGPMCGINRTSSEPPSHLECGRFSAKYCPFLARPQMERRSHDDLAAIGGSTAGVAILRNPAVTLLWDTRSYTPCDDGRGEVLFRLGDPIRVEWWREGRAATRAEVEESVRTGLPILAGLDQQQEGALQALTAMATKFESMYPAL